MSKRIELNNLDMSIVLMENLRFKLLKLEWWFRIIKFNARVELYLIYVTNL